MVLKYRKIDISSCDILWGLKLNNNQKSQMQHFQNDFLYFIS